MLETCTVSGFNTASILSFGNLQINAILHDITIEGVYGIALSLYHVEMVVDFITALQ